MGYVDVAKQVMQEHPAWIPQRLITSKKAVAKDSDRNIVDLDALRATPDLMKQHADLLRKYPNMPAKVARRGDEAVIEHFINHVKDNLLDLHDRIPHDIRERSSKWYDGARAITDRWTKDYNLPDHSIAGVLASLSPQKDWYQNVSLAQRVLDLHRGQGENFYHGFTFNPQMSKTFRRIKSLNKDPEEDKHDYQGLHDLISGKSLGDLDKLDLHPDQRTMAKALWTRIHDETFGDKSHPIVTPEGEFGAPVKTATGAKAKVGWGSLTEIGKAIRAIEAKDNPRALSEIMGEKHKVRNFYNNILSPNSKHGDVTIDTHAVAAGLLRPLAGKDTEVAHNFSNYAGKGQPNAGGSAITGVQGLYPLYAEAYRRAASERGILPRQMQSITWEGIRGLFPDTFKTKQNKADIDQIWKQHRKGEISQTEARRQVYEKAGQSHGGIQPPTWTHGRSPYGLDAPYRGAADARALSQPEALRGAPGRAGPGGGGGAGPPVPEQAFAQGGDVEGPSYDTKQDGPFYRVQPAGGTRPQDGGVRQAPGSMSSDDGGGEGQVRSAISPRGSAPGIAPGQVNRVHDLANSYMQKAGLGRFRVPEMPESSLRKQSAIGIAAALANTDHPAYKQAVFDAHQRLMPDVVRQSGARNYDELRKAAYAAMAKETAAQFAHLPLNYSFHRNGEGNYPSSKAMTDDVHGNNHLYVYQGGDKHDFLHNVDPKTGLNENEKFRAVHDAFGHGVLGNQFGAKGEETAWGVHQQMYSPLARLAMSSETRGQNSQVNYTPLNAELKARIAAVEQKMARSKQMGWKEDLPGLAADKQKLWNDFQFAPNKATLLPPEMVDPKYNGGMPDYMQKLMRPQPGTTMKAHLTHFSTRPDLQKLDPKRYGTGIPGDEAGRVKQPGGVAERAYAYLGKPDKVTPEDKLGPHAYRSASRHLYDLQKDPLKLGPLAREANRSSWLGTDNPGAINQASYMNDLERMAKEHGYHGVANPNAIFPMATLFRETPVKPAHRAAGGDVEPDIQNPVPVFPKPQRMLAGDDFVPGGKYLNATTKQDMTGHKAAAASIGIAPGGKPYFRASADAVDATGSPKGALAKTNLFKQRAGWNWSKAPEGHENTSTIVSVEHRGKHYYTLNAHFPKGVDFARYADARSEPRLRPTTRGDIALGPTVGAIKVRGADHPVFGHVIVKQDGGSVQPQFSHSGLHRSQLTSSQIDRALQLTARRPP